MPTTKPAAWQAPQRHNRYLKHASNMLKWSWDEPCEPALETRPLQNQQCGKLLEDTTATWNTNATHQNDAGANHVSLHLKEARYKTSSAASCSKTQLLPETQTQHAEMKLDEPCERALEKTYPLSSWRLTLLNRGTLHSRKLAEWRSTCCCLLSGTSYSLRRKIWGWTQKTNHC